MTARDVLMALLGAGSMLLVQFVAAVAFFVWAWNTTPKVWRWLKEQWRQAWMLD